MSFKCKYLCILEKCCCCIDLRRGNIGLGLTIIGTHSLYFISQMALTYQIINDTSGHFTPLLVTFQSHMHWLLFWVSYQTLTVCMGIVHVSGAIQDNERLLAVAFYWNCCNVCFITTFFFMAITPSMAIIVAVLIYYTILNYSLLHEINSELNAYIGDDNEWSYELHPFYN